MDFYGKLYRRALWPLYESARGRYTHTLLKIAERNQWKSPTKLRQYQEQELAALLRQTYEHSPWHRARFDKLGLKPEPLALARLPVLTKDDIRQHRDEMLLQNNAGTAYLHKTGGSTGMPLSFHMTRPSYEWRNAVTLRAYGWAGAHEGVKAFYLWSIPVDNPSWLRRTKTALHDWSLRRMFFNNFRLSRETLPECLDALNRFAPRVLVGYTSMLEYLARHIKKHGGLRVKLRSVITAAEGVNEAQRELLREVFNAPVFASYGSREFKLIAMECDRGGLHISADNLIVECLQRGQPAPAGELGQVVITDLHNLGTPFLRYEIGDVATVRDGICPCGRGLPLLGAVHGRIPDTIQSPDGKLISGIFFPHLLKEFDWIEQFQVIQKELDRVHLKIVTTDQPAAERGLPQLRQAILAVLGNRVRLEVEFVCEIPRTASGKHRAVISEIPVIM